MNNEKDRPLSIEQAYNRIKEIKAERPDPSSAVISTATPEQRKKYLRYCISFCRDPRAQFVLKLRGLRGTSYEHIAIALQHYGFGLHTVEKVKMVEGEGIRRVNDEISKGRQFSIPIIGGM